MLIFQTLLKYWIAGLIAGTCFLHWSCKKAEITTYTIPKEDTSSSIKHYFSWETPDDWQEQKATPPRKASYTVNGSQGRQADLSVTTFPGAVGGLLPNINRWRNQLGLEPVTEETMEGLTETVIVNSEEATLVDLKSDTRRMLVLILVIENDSWFFKFTGDLSLIDEQYPYFYNFIQSIRF